MFPDSCQKKVYRGNDCKNFLNSLVNASLSHDRKYQARLAKHSSLLDLDVSDEEEKLRNIDTWLFLLLLLLLSLDDMECLY